MATFRRHEYCPDCRAHLPAVTGLAHPYLGASSACWALYAALNSGGEPPLLPAPHNALLTDAYAAQHPGVPSSQAIQSVAVHLLTLYGVLVAGVDVQRANWVRQTAVRDRARDRTPRFVWLTPPSFAGTLTVADIVAKPTPQARTELLRHYIDDVWAVWSHHHATVAAWYRRYVAGN